MQIFLIHDPLRDDRRRLYTKEMNEQDIHEWYVVPAVKTQKTVHLNIMEAHKSCIRLAMKNKMDRVVVMEDDVKFACPGAYKRFLELAESWDGWDMLTTGSYEYTANGEYVGLYLARLTRFSGLHCYMVDKKFYQQFLDTKLGGNFDKSLRGKIYMTYPMLALQWDTYSANVKRVTNYNERYKDKINLWTNDERKI